MPINPGDSKASVIATINAIITDAGLDAAENTDTTSATHLLNQVAGFYFLPGLTENMAGDDAREVINNLENGSFPTVITADADAVTADASDVTADGRQI